MDMKEKTNPVFNTAKFTLGMLAGAGVQEAGIYLQALGFDMEQISSFGIGENTSANKALPTTIIQEARYDFVNRMIEASGAKTIVDMACGFSPRGYKYAELGYHYIGLDLPATVEAVAPVVESISKADWPYPITYAAVDLTNADRMDELADQLDDAPCLVTEGLLMYLDRNETSQLIDGIKRIIRKKGGCFVTPDYASVQFFFAVLSSMYGKEQAMKIMMAQRDNLSKTSDSSVGTANSYSLNPRNDEEAYAFFTERGLKIERVPFYQMDRPLKSVEKLAPELAMRIRTALSRIMVWVATLDEDNGENASTSTSVKRKAFALQESLDGGIWKLALAGRLDSISAPELLARFEEVMKEGAIGSVEIDCKELDYISSAGLRILLTMLKQTAENRVVVENVSDEVEEILRTTGFLDILKMR